MTHPHNITDPFQAHAFIFGGKARFTLVSTKTGKRFTYRVKGKETESNPIFFANLLVGSDNTTDYEYIGYSKGGGFASGAKGQPNHPAFKALAWAEAHFRNGVMPDKLEFWHEGRCAKCARPLTDPVSIARGLGPECATKGL